MSRRMRRCVRIVALWLMMASVCAHGADVRAWLDRNAMQLGETVTLNFAERSPSGWTAPMSVTSGKLVTNYADVPSVLRLSDGTLAAQAPAQMQRLRAAMR